MKNIFSLAVVVLLFSFIQAEDVEFKSPDGKTKITATDQWKAAGNMKGVEIFISRPNKISNISSTVVVSKDENILEGTSLNIYSAGKLFLQTAVLKTSPSFSGTKTINGIGYKYYEYEYDNKDMVKMKTLVYHTLIGSTGFQMVITSPFEGFDQNKPLYNKIASTIKLSK